MNFAHVEVQDRKEEEIKEEEEVNSYKNNNNNDDDDDDDGTLENEGVITREKGGGGRAERFRKMTRDPSGKEHTPLLSSLTRAAHLSLLEIDMNPISSHSSSSSSSFHRSFLRDGRKEGRREGGKGRRKDRVPATIFVSHERATAYPHARRPNRHRQITFRSKENNNNNNNNNRIQIERRSAARKNAASSSRQARKKSIAGTSLSLAAKAARRAEVKEGRGGAGTSLFHLLMDTSGRALQRLVTATESAKIAVEGGKGSILTSSVHNEISFRTMALCQALQCLQSASLSPEPCAALMRR